MAGTYVCFALHSLSVIHRSHSKHYREAIPYVCQNSSSHWTSHPKAIVVVAIIYIFGVKLKAYLMR